MKLNLSAKVAPYYGYLILFYLRAKSYPFLYEMSFTNQLF
jgi:hypothetical protein